MKRSNRKALAIESATSTASVPIGIGLGLVVVLLFLTYANSLDNDFHYDDYHSIVQNRHIRSLANIPQFFTDPQTFSMLTQRAMFRPLVLTSYALNHHFGQYQALRLSTAEPGPACRLRGAGVCPFTGARSQADVEWIRQPGIRPPSGTGGDGQLHQQSFGVAGCIWVLARPGRLCALSKPGGGG